MATIDSIINEIVQFRDERDWEQFHNSKDLALAISIEAAELNELFLWKDSKDVNLEKLKDELADVFIYSFLLAHKHGLTVGDIIQKKLESNSKKYPIHKSKGNAKKYDEF